MFCKNCKIRDCPPHEGITIDLFEPNIMHIKPSKGPYALLAGGDEDGIYTVSFPDVTIERVADHDCEKYKKECLKLAIAFLLLGMPNRKIES